MQGLLLQVDVAQIVLYEGDGYDNLTIVQRIANVG